MSDAIKVPENFQYLRPNQVEEIERESSMLGEGLRTKLPTGLDKKDMHRRKQQLDKMLSEQQAPDLNPTERDAYAREARRLESEFTVGMPSAEEMRKNPPGAVDRNLAWHLRNRKKIARWKNVMRTLHKGDTSPDLANVERFRRHTNAGDLSMAGAQIPGRLFVGTNPSPEYRENYDRIFPPKPPDAEVGQDQLDDMAALARAERASQGKPKPREIVKVEMRCGEMKDPRGRIWHEKNCAECQRIAAEAEQRTEAAGGSPAAE